MQDPDLYYQESLIEEFIIKNAKPVKEPMNIESKVENFPIESKEIRTGLQDQKKVALIKEMYCKDSTEHEFEIFIHACKHTGLDPLLKQIYFIKRQKDKPGIIQVSIDGYRLIAERTGKYAPGKEPTFQYDTNGNLISATAYVKKRTPDGTWHEIASTAFYEEYAQKKSDGTTTSFWRDKSHLMTAKCAEALALRRAFPAELSGIYTEEEMQQAEVQKEEFKPKLLDAPEISIEAQIPFNAFVFENMPPDMQEYALKQAEKRKTDIPGIMESINKSEYMQKTFVTAFQVWKEKRAAV